MAERFDSKGQRIHGITAEVNEELFNLWNELKELRFKQYPTQGRPDNSTMMTMMLLYTKERMTQVLPAPSESPHMKLPGMSRFERKHKKGCPYEGNSVYVYSNGKMFVPASTCVKCGISGDTEE